MVFRVLVLLIFSILAACSQNNGSAEKNVVSAPVSLKTYSVLDSTLLKEFFDVEHDKAFFKHEKDFNKVLDDVKRLDFRF